MRVRRSEHLQRSRPNAEKTAETRRSFLHRSAVVAPVAVLAAGAVAEARSAPHRPFRDLYPGWQARNFQEIQADENAHVKIIIDTITQLGGTPRPKPTFQNLVSPTYLDFIQKSYSFENTGASAYLGAAPSIDSYTILSAAAAIAIVEAYHSGYINTLVNAAIVPGRQSLVSPLTQDQVLQRVSSFIVSLNGGPAPAFSNQPSPDNDIAIWNFALVLEYLEAEFYNDNVPRFF